MLSLVHAAIACTLGFFWAHVMEYVAIHHYGTPVPSAAGIAGMTFFGTSLIAFSVLRLFSGDSR